MALDQTDGLSPSKTKPENKKITPPPIPDHELLVRIDAGSYGEVWLGRNVLGTFRAVKIVYRQSFEEADAFEREFNGLQKFEPISRTHDGLVDILQVGRTEDWLYYVMELADNIGRNQDTSSDPIITTSADANYKARTLRKELSHRGRLPADECIAIGLKLTSALAKLHEHGLVHRDVKPSNIIFVNSQPKLADVGLVAESTEARSLVGTVGYIPPDGPGTEQADLYSLGKVLYEISTGCNCQKFPVLPANLHEFPDRQILVELNEVILKACEEYPNLRYSSAKEMHKHLLMVQEGGSIRWRRWLGRHRSPVQWFAAAFLLAILLTYALRHPSSDLSSSTSPNKLDPSGNTVDSLWQTAEVMEKEGDHWMSLLTYVKAHQLVLNDPDRDRSIRSRIANRLQQFPPLTILETNIGGLAEVRFTRDGASAILFSGNEQVDVYDRKGTRFRSTIEHDNEVLSVNFSPDGTIIFTVTRDGRGHFWNALGLQSVSAPGLIHHAFNAPGHSWDSMYKHDINNGTLSLFQTNSALRIFAPRGVRVEGGRAFVTPPGESPVFSDVILSLDILDWDKSAPEQQIGLVARGKTFRQDTYVGALKFQDPRRDGKPTLEIFHGSGIVIKALPAWVDPENQYRLVFSVLGKHLNLSLFELGDLTRPMAEMSVMHTKITAPGHAYIWVGEHRSLDRFCDITVDNFLAAGTLP